MLLTVSSFLLACLVTGAALVPVPPHHSWLHNEKVQLKQRASLRTPPTSRCSCVDDGFAVRSAQYHMYLPSPRIRPHLMHPRLMHNYALLLPRACYPPIGW